MRVADYVMDCLVRQGVKHVFVLPGGGAMHLVDALGLNPYLDYIPTHHEQACAIAAEAYSRVNENLGVALVTTGPGGTNAITGVVGAWIESVPMLVISGQVKRADLLHGKGVRQMGVQEVDIVSLIRPVTKYAATVERPEAIRLHLEKALTLARHGRQGPVWLDIPLDVQGAQIDPDSLEGYNTELAPIGDQVRIAEQIERTVVLMNEAQRPLILAGHGIRLAGAAQAFRHLVEVLNIPVVATWNAMDLIPHDHCLFVGKPGVVALRGANFAVQNCDLLLAIGCRLDNVITAYNYNGFARAAIKVLVDVDLNELTKFPRAPELAIQADAGVFIQGLLSRAHDIHRLDRSAWLGRCERWKQRFPVMDGKPFPNDGEISHFHFVDALSDEIHEDTLIVTGSSGLGVEAFYTAFRHKRGQRVFLTSGLGAMGYGIPAAIGACLAADRKRTVLVESDGSLQLNLQELATLRGLGLPMTSFIMNNQGYASIRTTQRNYFDGRYVGTGPEAKLWFPDVQRLADAYGISALRIEDASQLCAKIREALEHPGPCICEVMLKTDEALWPKVAAIPQADGSMKSMPLEDMWPLLSRKDLRENMLIPLDPASEKLEV
ncbi:MAG TPA: thiamine pyrophosphate-binding protein [Syntrophobacteria bacterium]|nr:thiamine pyrophosphate-binding protein [Syntrophobacteria bacterium]